jgi:hypothetical protein
MHDQILENVDQNPYLGVLFTNTLKWGTHINNILAKANKSLGFLRRNISKFPEEIKKRNLLICPDLFVTGYSHQYNLFPGIRGYHLQINVIST